MTSSGTPDPIAVLSDLTAFSKYARYLPELERRETYEEIVARNMDMHVKKFPYLADVIRKTYGDYVLTKKVLPSMRSLQFGGAAILRQPQRMFNCAYLPVKDIEGFSETMYLLLSGCGVGYSVQWQHVRQLSSIVAIDSGYEHTVEDSIEGWADAVKALVSAYIDDGTRPVFNYKQIRPEGTPLKTSGGKAPGAEPLRRALENVEDVLASKPVGYRLRPIDCHDMLCFIADAVRAGGIRRSAMIALFSPDDEEMLNSKGNLSVQFVDSYTINENLYKVEVVYKGEHRYLYLDRWGMDEALAGRTGWWNFESQRGRANNSVVLNRHDITQERFTELWKVVRASGSGEPGFIFSNNLEWGTNPCAEVSLRPYSFCNLTEINASNIESQSDLNGRAWAAGFISTLQASYTDFPYLRAEWKRTTDEDALIGVGATGVASGNFTKFDLEQAAKVIKEANKDTARIIGIKPAARQTTLKPSGTSSLLLGTSSGIHPWHSKYYLRRMRFGKEEAVYKYLKELAPEFCEDDLFSPDMGMIAVPVKSPNGAVTRDETAVEFLGRVRDVNLRWVRAGHITGENANNVSATVSVREDEWDDVGEWMWNHRSDYNGISVLPASDHTYQQAPFEDLTEEQYLSMVESFPAIDLTQVLEGVDETDLSGEVSCASGACDLTYG